MPKTKTPTQPPKKKRRKKNHYFTQDHEDAIIRYCQTTCVRERTELYVKWIEPAFNEMVDKIVFTYKFTNLPNIDSLRDECKIWLMTILDKYDPAKGLKSWDTSQMKENDLKVYKAICVLFDSKEEIQIFNKKAIYLYLREITGLNTKQIVNSLKKFKKKYYYFTQNWNNGALWVTTIWNH